MATGHTPGARRNKRTKAQGAKVQGVRPDVKARREAGLAKIKPSGEDEFIDALRKHGGDLYLVSIELDLAYQTVRRRCWQHPHLALVRDEARKEAWEKLSEQAEDNIRSQIEKGDVKVSQWFLGVKDPKNWTLVDQSEQKVIHVHMTAEDHHAFERADSIEDALIEEKKKAQELQDQLRNLQRQISSNPSLSPLITDAEVVNGA